MAKQEKDSGKTDYKKSVEASPPRANRVVKPGTSRGLPQGKPQDDEKERRLQRERRKMIMQARAYMNSRRGR